MKTVVSVILGLTGCIFSYIFYTQVLVPGPLTTVVECFQSAAEILRQASL